MIPDGWMQICLEEAAANHRHAMADGPFGSNLKSEHYRPSGIPVIQSGFVTSGRFAADHYVYVDQALFREQIRSRVVPGDIVMAKIGAKCGTCAILPEGHPEAIIAGNCLKITTDPQVCSNQFLLHTLQFRYQKTGLAEIKTETAQPAISLKSLKGFNILLPPLSEQRKIAAILGAWDEAITLTERRIAAGRQRKQGLMQRLLTGQVRFPEFCRSAERQQTKFGDTPSDWQLVQLENVAAVNSESLAESSHPDHKWLYIDLSAVNQGAIVMPTERRQFADLPSRARRVLREGDVIMATVRPNLLGFAICDFAPDDVLCSTGFALISAKILSDARFIYQSLYSKMILGQIQGLLTGSSYPAINSSEVKGLWFCWPQSAEEREKIAEVLAACDHELDLLARKRDALQQQKRGLMQQLLTGRVRVKVLDHGAAK